LDGFDKGVLLVVLAIYAVMGAISFYERATDKTTAYFRHLGIILVIRDLWTKGSIRISQRADRAEKRGRPEGRRSCRA
jgi:hypothetical protein